MGLFLCELCDEHLSLQKHTCSLPKIKEKIHRLEEERQIAEDKLHNIHGRICLSLQKLIGEDGKIHYNDAYLQDMWIEGWENKKSSIDYLANWMAMHEVLRRAFDLFRSTGEYNEKSYTLKTKLQRLYDACERAKEKLGYQSSKFTLKPEDICQKN